MNTYISCRYLFKEAFKSYLVDLCGEESIEERANNLIARIKRINPTIDIDSIKNKLIEHMHRNNQKMFFEECVNIFLMYDLSENNKINYAIDYEKLMSEI